jgi:hypothetical protein
LNFITSKLVVFPNIKSKYPTPQTHSGSTEVPIGTKLTSNDVDEEYFNQSGS